MPGITKYLFDSDVLIASARLHYSPSYCQAFWEWLDQGHQAGLFFSIDKVKSELLAGPADPLNKWAGAKTVQGFFQPSLPSLAKWKDLGQKATDPAKSYTEGAMAKFLDVNRADAWLIAHAAHHGDFKIVTNESSSPNSKKDIKLPDAAAWLGVGTVKLFDIFQIHAGHNFSFNGF